LHRCALQHIKIWAESALLQMNPTGLNPMGPPLA
jgi:hypothetical protein